MAVSKKRLEEILDEIDKDTDGPTLSAGDDAMAAEIARFADVDGLMRIVSEMARESFFALSSGRTSPHKEFATMGLPFFALGCRVGQEVGKRSKIDNPKTRRRVNR